MTRNKTAIELPKFEGSIKIEVPVQTIHDRLLGEFPSDYKHKEILTHAVIGCALENGGLDHIYNALNGYPATLDFQVGDSIICKDECYDYALDPTAAPTDDLNWVRNSRPIGTAMVMQVNPYKKYSQVKIAYDARNSKGDIMTMVQWVSTDKCRTWDDATAEAKLMPVNEDE